MKTKTGIEALNGNSDIAKAIGKAMNLPVGEHRIFANITVDATVKIGESYEQEIWQSAEPMALLAIMADKLNEATLNKVISEYTEALKAGTLDEHKAKSAGLKDRVTEAIRTVKGPTKKTCAGKTTFKDIAVSALSGAVNSTMEDAEAESGLKIA
jgi:hypothetical protein